MQQLSISDRIDELIKKRGWSRRQLAIKANIPPSSFQSAMERGNKFTMEMLQAVADAFEMSLIDFVTYCVSGSYVAGYNSSLETKRAKNAANEDEYNDAVGDAQILLWDFDRLDVINQKRAVNILSEMSGRGPLYELTELNERDRYSRLNSAFDALNDFGQCMAVERVEELTEIKKYKKKKSNE